MGTASLLIVDDQRERAGSVLDRVRSDSWTCSIATSAGAAVEMVNANPVSLVLSDVGVWKTGGLGACLAEDHPSLPVIVLTGKGEDSAALVQHLKLGAMTYVPRDSGRRRLIETIQSILDLTRLNPYRSRVRKYLRGAEVELHVDNDPSTVGIVVGYLQRILEDYGLSNEGERFRVGLALNEAISNAIIHGNLEISSQVREGGGDGYYEEIEKRRRLEPYLSRSVQIVSRFGQSSATFVIRDQGKGFDRASLPDPTDPENLTRSSGRGILIMQAYTDLVTWNESGNEVTLVKKLNRSETTGDGQEKG